MTVVKLLSLINCFNLCKMGPKQGPVLIRYRHFFITLFVVLIISIFILVFGVMNILLPNFYNSDSDGYEHISLGNLERIPFFKIPADTPVSSGRNNRCSYYDCFSVYHCGHSGSAQISVYVYPLKKYVDDKAMPIGSQMSKEFYGILKTIINSKYYTPNPEEACLFIPSIDTLNQNRFRTKETSQALASLP